MKHPLSYDPAVAEQHTANVIDFSTCEGCGQRWPCIAQKIMWAIDRLNEDRGVDLADPPEHWLFGT